MGSPSPPRHELRANACQHNKFKIFTRGSKLHQSNNNSHELSIKSVGKVAWSSIPYSSLRSLIVHECASYNYMGAIRPRQGKYAKMQSSGVRDPKIHMLTIQCIDSAFRCHLFTRPSCSPFCISLNLPSSVTWIKDGMRLSNNIDRGMD